MFYKKFCEICRMKGLKPTNVVKELGLSSGNMTNWKNGRIPKTEVINKISQYLEVPINFLLSDTPFKEKTNTFADSDIRMFLFGNDINISEEMLTRVRKYIDSIKDQYI